MFLDYLWRHIQPLWRYNESWNDVTFVDADASEEEIKAFRPNTKALFGETIQSWLQCSRYREIRKNSSFPRCSIDHLDNTFVTLLSTAVPLNGGAGHCVTPPTTKYTWMVTCVGGARLLDSGNFD